MKRLSQQNVATLFFSISRVLITAAVLTMFLAVCFWPSLRLTIQQPDKPFVLEVTYEHNGTFSPGWSQRRAVPLPSGPSGYQLRELVFAIPPVSVTNIGIERVEGEGKISIQSVSLGGVNFNLRWDAASVEGLFHVNDSAFIGGQEFRLALAELCKVLWLWLACTFVLLCVVLGFAFRFSAELAETALRLSVKQERILVVAMVLSTLAVLFRKFLFGDALYLFADIGMDTYGQYFPILAHWADRWQHDHQLFWPFWTFQLGAGTNLGPQLLDPFNLVAVLCGKDLLPLTLAPLAIIKYCCLAVAAHTYLNYHVQSSLGRIIGSFWITFSGFAVVWGQHYFYLTYAIYILLLLIGFERLRRGEGQALLVLASALIASLSVTLLLSAIIFLAIQQCFTAKRIKTPFTSIITGIGISAFLSLPLLFRLIENHPPRPPKDSWNGLPLVLSGKEILTNAARLVSSDLLGTGNYFSGALNYYEAPNLYCGLLCLLAFAAWLKAGAGRRLLPLAIYSLAFCFPPLAFLLTGFVRSETRELGLFFVLLLTVPAADGLLDLATGKAGRASKLMFAGFVAAALLAAWRNGIYRGDVIAEVAAFALVYLTLASKKCFPLSNNIRSILFLIFALIEALLFAEQATNDRFLVSKRIFSNSQGYADNTQLALEHLPKATEPFRLVKQYQSVASNDALYQSFNSVGGYFSFHSAAYRSFLKEHGATLLLNERVINSENIPRNVLDVLSVRYFLTKDAFASLPDTRSVGVFGDITVLENLRSQPFIRFSSVDASANLNRWSEDSFEFSATATKTVEAVLAMPFDRGWHLEIDGQAAELLNVEGGLLGFQLQPGSHQGALSYWPRGFSFGILISLVTAVYSLFLNRRPKA